MVCHVKSGLHKKWVYPEEVIKSEEGRLFHKETKKEIKEMRSEKCQSQKKI